MKKILIIGAGFLQDFVIRKAKSMGYVTLAVDADPNAIGFAHADEYKVINIVDEKACLDYAKEQNVDGVLTAATDYGVLTASYIAEQLNLPGLNYEAAKTIKNKYLVRKCLYEHKVDDTEQAYEISADTNISVLKEKLTYPVMVKPCDGSGSRGASRVDTKEQLEQACAQAMDSSITNRAEIESFIVGKEYGAESLVVNGEVNVLAIMKKHMTKHPYYAELGHAIPTDLPIDVEQRAKECVKKAIQALNINFGSVNMDMIITAEGKIYIVDIGARMGGNLIGSHIVPYGTGIDYMGNMIKNAVGDKVDLSVNEHSAVATRLLAFKGGIINQLPDFQALEKKYSVEIYHHMKLGDKVNEYRTNLDGLGYIVGIESTVYNAEINAQKTLEDIDKLIGR